MSTLRANGLCKSYRDRQVVRDVTLEAGGHEAIGLLGPNGAGKTTCFYMITGLIACDAGQILLDEQDVTALPMSQRARQGIGYLPQEPSVFRRLTVAENILGVLELLDLSKQERQQRLESLLEEFSVAGIRDNRGFTLSGGERRRVEIARALAMEPDFILLDEPFAGVDPLHVADIKSVIQQLQHRGIGIIITDHNVRETLSICERAYILSEGQVIAQGGPQEILQDPRVRETYLGTEFQL